MANSDFDTQAAHEYFSKHCFNSVWGLIDRAERSPQDDETMLRLAQASLWHWQQRTDCQPKNLSIGYWQLSRVCSLLNRIDDARDFGKRCLDVTPTDDAFCMGYAYEALARAEHLAGDSDASADYLSRAREQAEAVADAKDREYLLGDLDSIAPA